MSVRGYRHGAIILFLTKKHFLSPKNTFLRQKFVIIALAIIKKWNCSTMAVTSNTHLYRRGGIDEFKKKNFCSRFISPWWYSRTFEITTMAIKSRFYGIFGKSWPWQVLQSYIILEKILWASFYLIIYKISQVLLKTTIEIAIKVNRTH